MTVAVLDRVIAAPQAQESGPAGYRFSSSHGQHLLVVAHSQIYDVDIAPEDNNAAASTEALSQILGHGFRSEAPLDVVSLPTVQSISLNVSSSCNLGCSYCYANQGNFKGKQKQMLQWETARIAIDRLLDEADSAAPITLGFMGGEPFVNRELIHRSVHYSTAIAQQRGLDLRFSVTTNGTLLREEDRQLLRQHRFAVTVSVDGGHEVQNRQRPMLNGRRDSFAAIRERVQPLLQQPGLAKLSARATTNVFSLDIANQFAAILDLGFTDVGFSPLRAQESNEAVGALQNEDWVAYQEALIAVAQGELQRAKQGESIRLSNFATALKQLHVGASSPFPCGAGGGYFSVSSTGDWYACHRAIGNEEYRLGDSQSLQQDKRIRFLQQRHVHAQTDCQSCWARYLCSGGCHQEKASRSVASCDFVRGWLTFCLQSYCDLTQEQPYFFDNVSPRVII